MKLLKKTSLLFLIIGAGLANVSCEGGTHREWNITNNSSSTVFVEIENFESDIEKDTIQAGETKQVISYSTFRGAHPTAEATESMTSFLLYNANDTTEKSGLVEGNWLTESEQTSKIPSDYTHIFTFSIANSDF